jgi:hypothetical protein
MLRVHDVKVLLFGEPGSRYEGDLYVLFPQTDIWEVSSTCYLYTRLRGCE